MHPLLLYQMYVVPCYMRIVVMETDWPLKCVPCFLLLKNAFPSRFYLRSYYSCQVIFRNTLAITLFLCLFLAFTSVFTFTQVSSMKDAVFFSSPILSHNCLCMLNISSQTSFRWYPLSWGIVVVYALQFVFSVLHENCGDGGGGGGGGTLIQFTYLMTVSITIKERWREKKIFILHQERHVKV